MIVRTVHNTLIGETLSDRHMRQIGLPRSSSWITRYLIETPLVAHITARC